MQPLTTQIPWQRCSWVMLCVTALFGCSAVDAGAQEQMQRVQCFAAGRMRFCSLWKASPPCMSCRSCPCWVCMQSTAPGCCPPSPCWQLLLWVLAMRNALHVIQQDGWGQLWGFCKHRMDLHCSSSSTQPVCTRDRACSLLLLQAAKEHGTCGKSSRSLLLRTCSSIAGGDAELCNVQGMQSQNVTAKQRGKRDEESGLLLFLSLFFLHKDTCKKKILDKTNWLGQSSV